MALTREELENWALEKGYSRDRYGHLVKKTKQGKEVRLKMSRIAARYETKIYHDAGEFHPASSEWLRRRSGYLKDLQIGEDGRLQGMR